MDALSAEHARALINAATDGDAARAEERALCESYRVCIVRVCGH
jgi:hypothetical protein